MLHRVAVRVYRSNHPTTGRLYASGNSQSIERNTILQLSRDVQKLQQLVHETQSLQKKSLDSLSKQLEMRLQSTELRLDDIIHKEILDSPMAQVRKVATDYLQHNESLANLTKQINLQANRYPRIINKYTLAATLGTLLLLWRYWASIQTRTSKEVADLASKTLEQERLRTTIQQTLDNLAKSPETQKSLTNLLQSLIQEPSTQHQLVDLVVYAVGTESVQSALKDLLQMVFEDPKLQELSGVFLLKGLDVESVRTMLDEQTQDLVKRTVSDEAVQKATGTGIKKSVSFAILPFW